METRALGIKSLQTSGWKAICKCFPGCYFIKRCKFRLQQNYPNPFNPVTTISYYLARDTDVELAIYNMAGQNIITLLNGRQNAGAHQLQWQGIDRYGHQVGSGVYFYRLTAGEFIETKKMVLVR
ncbi:T9SS type A sorting domain-containing protein [candidate division KSB1 bacterium]|nr:T9SS type A sorting domain-containing protein [candidate division KSB1 bacterium]